MRVEAATRAGRSHRRTDTPCQDAQAHWVDLERPRACVAVADGLGSKTLSQHGSQAACDAVVAHLAAHPDWTEETLRAAFAAARSAVDDEAESRAVHRDDLATTLQVLVVSDGQVRAAMVGDGGAVAMHGGAPVLVLSPRPTRYANEVVPLTAPDWQDALQVASLEADGPAFIFTDGLVRLLLAKSKAGWAPFAPFFAAFVARIDEADVVRDFVHSDEVDASWDDDKCLAVVSHGPG